MALTVRTNGSASTNIITASWFNDYYNLLTGSMSDQPITVNNGVTLKATTSTPAAPTLALASGTALGIGAYTYGVAFVMGNGQTVPGTTATITTTSGNQAVNLSVIPTGPAGTTGRIIYRSKVGTTSPLYVVTTIANNTATTYSDTVADGSLGAQAPAHGSFGGYLLVQNGAGANKAQIFNDGSAWFDSGRITTDGAGNFSLDGISVNGESVGSLFLTAVTGGASSADLMLHNSSNGYITFDNIAKHVSYRNGLNAAWFDIFQSTGNAVVIDNIANAPIGFYSGVNKVAEMRTNGNFVISGTQYQTSSGSVSTASGQAFDAFDVAEVYPMDQAYASGTVVCPNLNNQMTQCTHNNCPCAMAVSPSPGLRLGSSNDPNSPAEGDTYDATKPIQQSIALAGRVNVKTAATLAPRTLVVSDGTGGVRAAAHGESAFVIGVTLNSTTNGQVGIVLKSLFGVVA